MDGITVNMLKDNNRTVVIIEGGRNVDERDELAYQIIQAYVLPKNLVAEKQVEISRVMAETQKALDENPPAEPENTVTKSVVEGLEPVASEPPKMPTKTEVSQMAKYMTPEQMQTIKVSYGKYAGMTPTAALRRDHEVALGEFFTSLLKAKISPEERQAIVRACRSYMRNLPNDLDRLDNKAKQMAFIRTCSIMINKTEILGRYGFISWDAMEKYAPDSKIREVVEAVAVAIAKRGT
jgi:hypothetical protein